MGEFQPDYLIIDAFKLHNKVRKNSKDKWALTNQKINNTLDNFVKESDGLMVKVDGRANGTLTYFLAWDGSKEWWDISNRYDKLRNKIMKFLIKNKEHVNWYRIQDIWDNYNYMIDTQRGRFFIDTKIENEDYKIMKN